ncbi:hypothetical protein [Rhizobium sp. FKL33]|uniref:hypothetical protein n=1 Tax=Rhizobium sp. FKL33 TaxID=2562307 RepID=UPI0010C09637|nr:hypothetical protein [Rhizobium sp. FKL33]
MTTHSNDRSVRVTVIPLDVIAQIAVINGQEHRLEQQPKRRFAVTTEAGGFQTVQAVFDDEDKAIAAAESLVAMVREIDAAEAATAGRTLQ